MLWNLFIPPITHQLNKSQVKTDRQTDWLTYHLYLLSSCVWLWGRPEGAQSWCRGKEQRAMVLPPRKHHHRQHWIYYRQVGLVAAGVALPRVWRAGEGAGGESHTDDQARLSRSRSIDRKFYVDDDRLYAHYINALSFPPSLLHTCTHSESLSLSLPPSLSFHTHLFCLFSNSLQQCSIVRFGRLQSKERKNDWSITLDITYFFHIWKKLGLYMHM